jgi:hypothetical protein
MPEESYVQPASAFSIDMLLQRYERNVDDREHGDPLLAAVDVITDDYVPLGLEERFGDPFTLWLQGLKRRVRDGLVESLATLIADELVSTHDYILQLGRDALRGDVDTARQNPRSTERA